MFYPYSDTKPAVWFVWIAAKILYTARKRAILGSYGPGPTVNRYWKTVLT